MDSLAEAISDGLTTDDSRRGLVNAVDGLLAIARALELLGNADAATPMGALEAHGLAVTEAAEKIADAIGGLAEAIREVGVR